MAIAALAIGDFFSLARMRFAVIICAELLG
jgi:hypothetical protein